MTGNYNIIWKYNKVFLLIYEIKQEGSMKRSHKHPCWAWYPSSVFHIFPYFNKHEMKLLHFCMAKKPTLKHHTFLSYHKKYSTVQPPTTNAYFKALKNILKYIFYYFSPSKKHFLLGVYSFLDLVAWTIMKQQWKKPKTNKQTKNYIASPHLKAK